MKKNKTITAWLMCLMLALAAVSRAADDGSSIKVYLTAKDTDQRLARVADLKFEPLPQPTEQQQCVFVDGAAKFQTLLGIGGALTDASAETFYKLPKDKQQELIHAYFDPQSGIGYSLGRTHIHSCDFSSE